MMDTAGQRYPFATKDRSRRAAGRTDFVSGTGIMPSCADSATAEDLVRNRLARKLMSASPPLRLLLGDELRSPVVLPEINCCYNILTIFVLICEDNLLKWLVLT